MQDNPKIINPKNNSWQMMNKVLLKLSMCHGESPGETSR
jgi:hypothetical protein